MLAGPGLVAIPVERALAGIITGAGVIRRYQSLSPRLHGNVLGDTGYGCSSCASRKRKLPRFWQLFLV